MAGTPRLKNPSTTTEKRDFNAAQQVDVFIANSTGIQADIEEFYQRKVRLFFRRLTCRAFRHLLRIASKHLSQRILAV